MVRPTVLNSESLTNAKLLFLLSNLRCSKLSLRLPIYFHSIFLCGFFEADPDNLELLEVTLDIDSGLTPNYFSLL